MALEMKESLVAYVDVLGFRAMVENPSLHPKIEDYLNTIAASVRDQTADRSDIEVGSLVFSDTTILVAEFKSDLDYLCKFLMRVRNFQYACAREGIWLRGAVSVGQLHFDSTQGRIVGSALNKAYDMEKLAMYPRIILEPSIIDRFSMPRREFLAKLNDRRGVHESGKHIVFDGYGTAHLGEFPTDAIFLDFLAPLRWGEEKDVQRIYDVLRNACNSRADTYIKYRWLIDYATRVAANTRFPILMNALQNL